MRSNQLLLTLALAYACKLLQALLHSMDVHLEQQNGSANPKCSTQVQWQGKVSWSRSDKASTQGTFDGMMVSTANVPAGAMWHDAGMHSQL